MLLPQNIETKIDFSVIRQKLSGLCSSPLGREEVEAMTFLTDHERVQRLLSEGQEMLNALRDASIEFPRGEIHDLREALARIRVEGLFLDETELHFLRESVMYVTQVEGFFRRLSAERFPILSTLHPASGSLTPVVGMIENILDRFGRLKDNASPELARIRKDLSGAQGSVSRAINSILRQAQAEGLIDHDVTPAMREGRLVLPVPPAMRRKMGGIVHDESATGKTVFIEPAEVVEANNRIRQLESEERRERAKILTEVTNQLRPYVGDILLAAKWMGEVDFLRAKALLGKELNALAPELENRPLLCLKKARHAVLYLRLKAEGREVVPLDLSLGMTKDQARILVISGPNAGGKSVCLKTVALTQYMLQCGLLVPVEESSRAGMFGSIFIDIGDEQSIADDLSTYSSHLRNMKAFVQQTDKKTLFLIDEFGAGTEPLMGGAIAEAILANLTEKGPIGIVTTHYTNLKHLADTTPGIVNGAMLYDRGALRPLFQLSVGQAGSSFALEIAKQTGLPDEILAHAKELVGSDHIDYDRSLQDIARDKRYWENKRQAIRQREKHLEERITHYETEIAGLKAKKKEILAEAKEKAADILQQSNATIERTIREIKEAKADKEKTKAARSRVEEMKMKVKDEKGKVKGEAKTDNREAKKGVFRDFAELKALTKNTARVVRDNEAVDKPFRPMISTAVVNEVRRKKLNFQRELDIRGLRADEATEQLTDYMDDAVMVAAGTVTILHGTGTGALKQLTRDYLQVLQRGGRIRSYHDGDPDRGGAGLTIVDI